MDCSQEAEWMRSPGCWWSTCVHQWYLSCNRNGLWLAPFANIHKDHASISPLQSNFSLYSEIERHLSGFFFPFHCPLPPCHKIWETQERREHLMAIGPSLQHTTLSCRQLSAGRQNKYFPILLKYYYFARLLDLSTSMACSISMLR